MSDKSKIEWTATRHADGTVTPGATWTPIRARRKDTGKVGVHCVKVSPECANCYASAFNMRNLPNQGTGLPFTVLSGGLVDVFLDEDMLLQPLRWKRPRTIFVCSQTDLFGEFVPDGMIDRVFAVMALCPQHRFLVLTKRSGRMREYFQTIPLGGHDGANDSRQYRVASAWASIGPAKPNWNGTPAVTLQAMMHWPLSNVWLGITAGTQATADERIPDLLATPAAKRFVSCEPLLEYIDLKARQVVPHSKPVNFLSQRRDCTTHASGHCLGDCAGRWPGIDWVIAGGESGRNARPMHPDWARSLRDQCVAAGVAFFFKQGGEWEAYEERGSLGLLMPCSEGPNCTALRVVEGADAVGSKWRWELGSDVAFCRVGKGKAGRLLDGRTWDEVPDAT